MDRTALVFFSLLFCLSTGRAQLYEGESCRLDNGVRGVCRSVPSCPGAQDQIIRGTLPKICSFNSHSPIVCCTTGGTVTTKRPQVTSRRPPATTPRRPTTTTRKPTTTTRRSTHPKRVDENTLAGRKCKEYERYVYWEIESPVLSVIPEYLNVSDCAQAGTTLIVGGVEAEAKEFPHMAALGFGPQENIQWKCGGSLISERYILTAAHCLSARGIGPVSWARMGDLNINSAADDGDHTLTVKVVERLRHEGYKPPAHYNDIALLKLENDIVFTPYIRPACIYTRPGNPINLNNATATGWGKLEFNEEVGSDKLMKVSLSLQDPSRCNHTYRGLIQTGTRLRTGIDPESMICAGDPRGERDTCGGDSGGPLQINLQEPDPVCMYSIIGLTSFGVLACGKGDSPAVYTRISNYVPWIERIVWGQN